MEEEIKSGYVAFTGTPRIFIRRPSTQFQVPHSTIHKTLHMVCELLHMKCSNHRPLGQKTSRDENSLQRSCWVFNYILRGTDKAHVEKFEYN